MFIVELILLLGSFVLDVSFIGELSTKSYLLGVQVLSIQKASREKETDWVGLLSWTRVQLLGLVIVRVIPPLTVSLIPLYWDFGGMMFSIIRNIARLLGEERRVMPSEEL